MRKHKYHSLDTGRPWDHSSAHPALDSARGPARLFPMKTLSLLGLCAVLATQPIRAGEPIKEGVSAEAHQLVKSAADFYTGLKSASADINLTITREAPGKPKKESTMKVAFAVQRPQLFRLGIEGQEGGVSIVCDGQSVWTYMPALKQFVVDSAPTNLDMLLRYHDTAPKALSQLGPLADLFRKDPAAQIFAPLTKLTLTGTEKLGGTECVTLHGEQADMDWDAWFEKGAKPLLRKFSFSPMKGILAQAPEEARAEIKDMRLNIVVEYNNWRLDAEPATGAFVFQPPEGAQKVAQFFAPEPGEAPGGGGDAESLKGKPAPDFTLATLDGGKMHLADLKGKVVVLDFWATWCGPCVRALPLVNEATAARKDKGVVFFAVNQQEEGDQIKAFLRAQKLDVSVALDAEGKAAGLFLVRGIPQTVIIDKAGNVASVHVGFSPTLKDFLGKELDEILAK